MESTVDFVHATEEFPQEWEKSLYVYTAEDCEEDVKRTLQSSLEGRCVVFLNLSRNKTSAYIDWEEKAVGFADMLLFWLPSSANELDIAKCSVNFGRWASSGKVVYGRHEPDAVESKSEEDHMPCGNMDVVARSEGIKINKTLEECIQVYNAKTKNGQLRTAAERNVPLHVWNHIAFKDWYTNMKSVGNRLDGAELKWAFCVGPNKAYTLYWVLHVNIWIAEENRNKSNEIVLARSDIKCVFPYYIPDNIDNLTELDCEVVLIKEFRSPARTEDCFIHELPGGSAFKAQDPIAEALKELQEETSLVVTDPTRMINHGARQLAGTTSAHQAHLFSIKLNDEEIAKCRQLAHSKEAQGNAAETERTYVEVFPLRELLKSNKLDWTALGMIHYVLHEAMHSSTKQSQKQRRSSHGNAETKGAGSSKKPVSKVAPPAVKSATADKKPLKPAAVSQRSTAVTSERNIRSADRKSAPESQKSHSKTFTEAESKTKAPPAAERSSSSKAYQRKSSGHASAATLPDESTQESEGK